MNSESDSARLEELEQHVSALQERVNVLEKRLREDKPAQQEPPPAPEPTPWQLALPQLENLVEKLLRAVKAGPVEVMRFDKPDPAGYLNAHVRNVARLAMFIAERHGFSETSLRTVGICALLHDAGMATLPDDVVHAGRPLSQEEFELIRMHPLRGAEYIDQHYKFKGLLSSVVPMVVEQHHERADGTGYPHGLDQDQIHDFARIIAIADSYEAMTSPRPFRAALHPAEAMRSMLMQGCRPRQKAMYDRNLMKTLVWSTSLYPVGCEVKLSDGCEARVVSPTNDPKRPVVELLSGNRGRSLNLLHHSELAIMN